MSHSYPIPTVVTLGKVHGNGALFYTFPENPQRTRARSDLLNRFCKLAAAEDQEILKFASNHGVLLHAPVDPPGENSRAPNAFEVVLSSIDRYQKTSTGKWWEPLDYWREEARKIAAVLSITRALRAGVEPANNDWVALAGEVPQAARSRRPLGKRRLLIAHMNRWLSTTTLGFGLRIDGTGYAMTTHIDSLKAALGLLLMEALLETRLVVCFGCGEVFNPTPTHRKYCVDCSVEGVPHRRAVERHRARERASASSTKM